MREYRRKARQLEAAVIIIVTVAVLAVVVSDASAHRIGWGFAHSSANTYVRRHYCGDFEWTCRSVNVPIVKCGLHSYCWWGVSHREAVCVPVWGCLWYRMKSSSGTVNGHTGKVTGYGEW